MAKETKEVKQDVPKQKTLQDLSDTELKAIAFEKSEQIKQLQRDYNVIYEELVNRQKKEE